jgi:hypothetical protein
MVAESSADRLASIWVGPLALCGHDAACSWAVGPGWYEAGLWPFVRDGASTLLNARDDERAGATYNKTAFDSP